MRPREPVHALPLAALAVGVTLILIAAGGHSSRAVSAPGPASWQGLAGSQRPRVAVGQRVIVLLKAPSLAQHLAEAPVGPEVVQVVVHHVVHQIAGEEPRAQRGRGALAEDRVQQAEHHSRERHAHRGRHH